MTAPQPTAGLSQIAAGYDALLCDVWGVIHNGRESFPAACAALARFRETRGPVILISNSPRPCGPVIEQLDGLGVPREAWSALVTSGDATRQRLASERMGARPRLEDRPSPWDVISSTRPGRPLRRGWPRPDSSPSPAPMTTRPRSPATTATASWPRWAWTSK